MDTMDDSIRVEIGLADILPPEEFACIFMILILANTIQTLCFFGVFCSVVKLYLKPLARKYLGTDELKVIVKKVRFLVADTENPNDALTSIRVDNPKFGKYILQKIEIETEQTGKWY